MRDLRVGEVAKRAGVNLQTIHYYERRGLLSEPPRTKSNYRAYSEDAVMRVRFIKGAQDLGFSLENIKELLSLRASPRAKCADVLRRAKEKVRDIDEKIATLRRMRTALSTLMDQCQGDLPVSNCPILESLDDSEANT